MSYCLAVILALILAALNSLSDFESRARNDLSAYDAHFQCIQVQAPISCRNEIGRPADFLYEFIVVAFNRVLLVENFKIFLLIFSFFIYFVVLSFPINLSKFYFIPLLFILSDFRFYELGGNVLRNGLALSILAIIVKCKLRGLINLAPIFSHISAAPFVLYKVFSYRPILGILTIFIAIVGLSFVGSVIQMFALIPIPELQGKIQAYFHESEFSSFAVSKTYLFYFFFLLFFCRTLKSDKNFLIGFGLFSSFFFFHLVFSVSEIGYRFLNYCVPFVGLAMGRVFDYLAGRYGVYAFGFLLFMFGLFFLVVILKSQYQFFR